MIVKVVFNPSIKNSFCVLSPPVIEFIRRSTYSTNLALELANINNPQQLFPIVVGWRGDASKYLWECIELSPQTGSLLGFRGDGTDEMELTIKSPISYINTLVIDPLQEEDWQIVELNANVVELTMLQQINVVSLHQVFPIFIGELTCKFRVTSLILQGHEKEEDSGLFGQLALSSLVSIAPKLKKKMIEKSDARFRGNISLRVQYVNNKNKTGNDYGLQECCSALCSKDTFDLFASNSPLLVLLSSTIFKQVIHIYFSPLVKPGHIILSSTICSLLGISPMERVNVRLIDEVKEMGFIPRSLSFHLVNGDSSLLLNREEILKKIGFFLLQQLKQQSKKMNYCLSNGMMICIPKVGDKNQSLFFILNIIVGEVKSQEHVPLYCMLPPVLPLLSIGEIVNIPPSVSQLNFINTISKLGGVEKEIQKLKKSIQATLSFSALKIQQDVGIDVHEFVLLTGGIGSGKSAILQDVCDWASNNLQVAHVIVEGKDLVGSKVQSIISSLDEAWQHCLRLSPCILVLEDFDLLVPFSDDKTPLSHHSPSPIATNAIVSWIIKKINKYKSLLKACTMGSRKNELLVITKWLTSIQVVATASSASSVHPSLLQSGLFDKIIPIPTFDANLRVQVLYALLQTENVNHKYLDVRSLSNASEGATPRDLRSLVSKAIHSSAIRKMEDKGNEIKGEREKEEEGYVLLKSDFDTAFSNWTPSSLKGVSLTKSQVKWESVGGLVSEKNILKEIFMFPIRYDFLFDSSPIPLARGVLLYGPPGCGKTLLAGAVAKECGLNFISVKGPEMLNKYIGASEAGVRDLFNRAMACAPSILFFDEFDAAAPKRGEHSGVTDRVVNQLLTFLDGVESRGKVFVLGASSRPDLLDPALLRPGRLDKLIYIGFPDSQTKRKEILLAALGEVKVSEDGYKAIDHLADIGQSYTGADLQAIVTTSHLIAAREVVDDEKKRLIDSTRKEEGMKELIVTKKHIESASESTKPSVSTKERNRYEAIYSQFWKARNGAKVKEKTGLKTTMAYS